MSLISIVPIPTLSKLYKTSYFMERILTRTEFDGMVDSNNNTVKKFVKRKASADTMLDWDFQTDVDLVDAMESDGILTTARHDEILLGAFI